ncbi:cystatin C (amyloid angiopathy and cerebral hemorrhage) [Cottoperca gobio]|uniref:Cystatin C (Amyloid angiopathy and cerebral hemorrhage) n=1 Tax=Cottoperca gobio TaxID=56716 RepID=A0A6J2R513_COTGO|nr:cystatin-like [Cottoperca gobio]
MMWKIVVPVFVAVFAVTATAGLVGGFSDVNVSDGGVSDALNFAVVQHNRGLNDDYLSQVEEVIKVQRQVVAGSKYLITVRMAKTSCRKGTANEMCTINQDPQLAGPYLCTFTVWSRPWINDIQLLNQSC